MILLTGIDGMERLENPRGIARISVVASSHWTGHGDRESCEGREGERARGEREEEAGVKSQCHLLA